MLHSANSIINYTISAEDGEIGQCRDFLFDEDFWTVRYMVADTRKWLPGKKVVISPISLKKPDWEEKRFPVTLTREQIKNSPLLDEHAPVSRVYERRHFNYYSWPYYWKGGQPWGVSPNPPAQLSTQMNIPFSGIAGAEDEKAEKDLKNNYLRSIKEVTGYHIAAKDDDCGYIDDFIIGDLAWTIRYLVVDTKHLLPGGKTLMPPHWITSIDWNEKKLTVDLTADEIKEGPEYNPQEPITREYETRLYEYYGKNCYWRKNT